MSRYSHPAIRQLRDQQVRYVPRDVRLKQIENAERLVREIAPDESYSYPQLCEEITSYRAELYPDLRISGDQVIRDLRCFIEDLSDSISLTIEQVDERVLTVEDVSREFNVSTKTVDRWRNRGLISRKFVFGKRKRIGFLESSVKHFVEQNHHEIDRSARFSQLTSQEREVIVRRARRLNQHGGGAAEISRRLAKYLGRSPETIRYTLRNYDLEHPETAVFSSTAPPLRGPERRELFRSFRRGASASALARRFRRTKASVYRIISEERARRLLEQPIDYMPSDEFHDSEAPATILTAPPTNTTDQRPATIKAPTGLPPYLASLYTIPLLSREEEAHYFRKMNYLKFRAAQLRDHLRMPAKSRDMETIENLLDDSLAVKNFLIRSNLRLVVSIAKRHLRPNCNFFEMVSDGNMSLMRAIEKFDYSLGNKFSTYASWAIMKNYARSIPAEHTQLDRFRTGSEEVFQNSTDRRGSQFHEELVNRTQHQLIMEILEQLDGRERDIIVSRYGLAGGREPQTLEEVGKQFGVTKERIRQIEARALKKLRRIAEDEHLDVPGI